MTLYDLVGDYKRFEEQIPEMMELIQSGELDSDVFDDTLESIQSTFEDKVDSLACIVKNQLAEIDAIKKEEESLAKRRKAKENAVERLKEYIGDAMGATGQLHLETPRNRLSFRKSESVMIENDTQLIEWALHNGFEDLIKLQDPTVNKTAVKNQLSLGTKVPFATVVTRMNLQIK